MKILLGFSLFLLVSCGDKSSSSEEKPQAVEETKEEWLPSDSTDYRRKCESEIGLGAAAASKYCDCIIDYIKTNYTPTEFRKSTKEITENIEAAGVSKTCMEIAVQ